ncbi:MAG: T9SS type A sorting domain-containing protein [Bacteroidetes bacterium]|nr:T9SS type A sorting domain-containing protein [Bacteroidota bacterium]
MITIKLLSNEAGEIQVVNLFGQIVYAGNVNTLETQMDVSNFADGMYVIRWSSGENVETKTFSVTK